MTETYCLTNDVDCSLIEDFDTVGEFAGSSYFTGKLLGNGYTISDFSTTDNGIFLRFSGEVSDLVMTNVYARNATIASRLDGTGLIVNVSVNGTIEALPEDHTAGIGGLVANMSAPTGYGIFNSSFDGNIEGGEGTTGGIVGLMSGGEISDCTVTATISSEGRAGGVIGNQNVTSHPPYNFIAISDSSFSGEVSGGEIVGGISGNFHNGTMEGCFSEGSVTSPGGQVGGLVGSTQSFSSGTTATIRLSSSTSSVTGGERVGGLVGILSGFGEHFVATIEQSFATGNVSGTNYVGGLLGVLSGASVIDSYATGDVVGSDNIGGLIGGASTCTGGAGDAVYSVGSVTGTGVYVGGMVGWSEPVCPLTASLTSTYWDTDSSSVTTSDGGEGRTTTEMTTEATFVDWDFTDTWTIDEGSSYPCLQWQGEDCPVP